MIKSFLMGLLAILLPWLALLIADNPGGALVALVMQATVIGWLPASIWAWRTVRETRKIELAQKRKKKEAKQEVKAKAKAEAKKVKQEARAESKTKTKKEPAKAENRKEETKKAIE